MKSSTKFPLHAWFERAWARPTATYTIFAGLLVSTLTLWLTLPSVDRGIYKLFGVSFLTLMGTQSGIGYNKETFAVRLALGFGAALVVAYAVTFPTPGKLRRAGVFFIAVLMGLHTFAVFKNPVMRDRQFEQLRMASLPQIEDAAVFAKAPFVEARVDNAADFHRVARLRFDEHRELLASRWHVDSEPRLRAFYYMSLVMSLWAYGNPELADRRRPSCALNNVNTSLEGTAEWSSILSGNAFRFSEVLRDATNPALGRQYEIDLPPDIFARYLEDDIGCCVDYVAFLSMLFSREGVENNLVVINGHWLVEARVDGEWYTFCPTTGLVFDGTWTEIQRRDLSRAAGVHLTVVPTPSATHDRDGGFRPLVGMLRLRTMMQAVDPSAPALKVFSMKRASTASPPSSAMIPDPSSAR